MDMDVDMAMATEHYGLDMGYGYGTDVPMRLRQLNRKRNYADFKEAEQNHWPGSGWHPCVYVYG